MPKKKQAIDPTKVRPGMHLNLGVLNVYHPGRRQYIEWRKPFIVIRVEIEAGTKGGLARDDAFMVHAYNREGLRVTWYETSSKPHRIG